MKQEKLFEKDKIFITRFFAPWTISLITFLFFTKSIFLLSLGGLIFTTLGTVFALRPGLRNRYHPNEKKAIKEIANENATLIAFSFIIQGLILFMIVIFLNSGNILEKALEQNFKICFFLIEIIAGIFIYKIFRRDLRLL